MSKGRGRYVESYPGEFVTWNRIKEGGRVVYYAYDPISRSNLRTYRLQSGKWTCFIDESFFRLSDNLQRAKGYLIRTSRSLATQSKKEAEKNRC